MCSVAFVLPARPKQGNTRHQDTLEETSGLPEEAIVVSQDHQDIPSPIKASMLNMFIKDVLKQLTC